MAEATLGGGRGMTPAFARSEAARLIALLLPLALLGGALGSQYLGGLYPCEMCYWQRWPHAAAIVLAALAFTASAASARSRLLTLLAALAIAVSGAIGVYHAGVELGIFEGFTTCTSTARAATTKELLDQLMKVPLVRCDQVQWAFLGISMAGWNAILSLGGATAIAWLALTGRRA
jgi:disulfide bond formation protein DsbB